MATLAASEATSTVPSVPPTRPPSVPPTRTKFPNFKRIVREKPPSDPASSASNPVASSPPRSSPVGDPERDSAIQLDGESEDSFGGLVHVPIISSCNAASAQATATGPTDEDDLDFPPEGQDYPDGVPELRVTRRSKVPDVCRKFYQAKAAARSGFDRMVVTTPNVSFVPPYPRETQVIETFSDGRWGIYEYAVSPQDLCRGRWHLACIPLQGPDYPDVLWHSLDPAKDWGPFSALDFTGMGHIHPTMRQQLGRASGEVIRLWENTMQVPAHVMKYARFLITILRQVVDRMNHLPAAPSVSVAVAAHVQRVSLELYGLKVYMSVVVPRLEGSFDYSAQVLSVVGAFVRDGSDAATLHRIGVPVWFLRPLTPNLPIWQVVGTSIPLSSSQSCSPPIFNQARSIAGVGSFTGAWQRDMVLAVSKHIAGRCMATISLAEAPEIPEAHSSKRPRVEESSVHTQHLGMRIAEVSKTQVQPQTKKSRNRRRGKGGDAGGPGSEVSGQATGSLSVAATSDGASVEPAKSFTKSPFVRPAPAWERALLKASPVPRSTACALYFYPPPFLLDTISSRLGPPTSETTEGRRDEKVHRYLHNFVRIREFLRARILDPSLSNEPLSIAEWRAALWGDYQVKSHPPLKHGSPSDLRRARRRQQEHNGIIRLFSRVAHVRSYVESENAYLDGVEVNVRTLAADSSIRHRILWESHEINFRAELMALDTHLVHKPSWWEVHRWKREGVVTSVWGTPSTVVTVIPRFPEKDHQFRWTASPEDALAHETLQAFLSVIAQWPDCPGSLLRAAEDGFTSYEFMLVQEEAVDFYVRTFVRTFHRLPLYPIATTV